MDSLRYFIGHWLLCWLRQLSMDGTSGFHLLCFCIEHRTIFVQFASRSAITPGLQKKWTHPLTTNKWMVSLRYLIGHRLLCWLRQLSVEIEIGSSSFHLLCLHIEHLNSSAHWNLHSFWERPTDTEIYPKKIWKMVDMKEYAVELASHMSELATELKIRV